MLHLETVDVATLSLLRKIQAVPLLSETRLVGGTALALQLGHRISGVNPALALRSLAYFEDAETMPMPRMLLPFDWQEAKRTILDAVRSLALQ